MISGAGVAWLINHFYKPVATISKTIVKETTINEISESVEKTSESLAAVAQYAAPENTTRVVQDITSKISLPNVALWFLNVNPLTFSNKKETGFLSFQSEFREWERGPEACPFAAHRRPGACARRSGF